MCSHRHIYICMSSEAQPIHIHANESEKLCMKFIFTCKIDRAHWVQLIIAFIWMQCTSVPQTLQKYLPPTQRKCLKIAPTAHLTLIFITITMYTIFKIYFYWFFSFAFRYYYDYYFIFGLVRELSIPFARINVVNLKWKSQFFNTFHSLQLWLK